MNEPDDRSDTADDPSEPMPPVHTARLQLVWDVVLLHLKLVADGVRDIVLSPLSIAALVMGLLAGGDDPHRYFRRVLRFGRRTELWINLFGHGRRRAGTSDALIDPVREHVFSQAAASGWLNRAGTRINETLDNVNASRNRDRSE